MTRLAVRALLAVVFWPSLFFFWFLGPFVFLLLSTTSDEVCPRLETRAEFLATANGTLPMLAVQSLIYAVPIVCLVLWDRLSPEPARARHVVTCVKLFAVTVVMGLLWAYGSSLMCDGYGQTFVSPLWQWASYLPLLGLVINVPLYVLTFSLGRAFSTREDAPADDATLPKRNAP
ncbi:hypothetical protein EN836_12570 [Mesorhizobium sp. M1C.F.Ca.ET.193.01.1.1]|uniref:hypothetical protein n=1 Tax=unclassified Mesorhizobium TaxID=325217 RepID=UPI000FD450D6|nr:MULTISPECIES: hypothetical protein [unclassified Mesorhizobium]TGT00493.1 hypothetical protein EN820_31300 [bacterium M00.F.Ca.ET.177.01.1.1]TGQ53907.1 hypothetical protein EN853_12570 [Mesorhizobium sp. M1C.F.Ca.ET.210.01.1.1]TGQ71929.1 hypothetical protein EN855_012580 [Mesorhizobium sp. M1C.F.Ca.ET.212.01.1.1]TGR08654.1 hypothetical protein EN847_12575 [Mesorhizobium sp. M1C.F.Ca.ET.204.01.1.1]TGR29390.1 hypothetical protein EN839_12575 [Mesorhizobium sp. M1C.F.Ca.ET.196.01.1.1]